MIYVISLQSTRFLTNFLLHNPRTKIAVKSDDILNLNVTSCFVDLYKETFKRWTEDFYGLLKASDSITGSSLEADAEQLSSGSRRRLPFVPFELRNRTGVPLWFATITCAPGENIYGDCGGYEFNLQCVSENHVKLLISLICAHSTVG